MADSELPDYSPAFSVRVLPGQKPYAAFLSSCEMAIFYARERISRPVCPGRFPMVGRERGVIVWPVSCRWRASCGGAAGPTLARAGRAACCCPRCCPAGLPQGSPRDARSREVAKKSPAAHPGTPPSLPAGGRGQVPAPGEDEPDDQARHDGGAGWLARQQAHHQQPQEHSTRPVMSRPVSLTVPVPDRRGWAAWHHVYPGADRGRAGMVILRQAPAISGSQFPAAGCGISGRDRERAAGVRQQAGRSRDISSRGEGGAQDGDDHVDQCAGVAVEGGAVVAVPFQMAVIAEPHEAEPRAGRAGDLDVGGGLE